MMSNNDGGQQIISTGTDCTSMRMQRTGPHSPTKFYARLHCSSSSSFRNITTITADASVWIIAFLLLSVPANATAGGAAFVARVPDGNSSIRAATTTLISQKSPRSLRRHKQPRIGDIQSSGNGFEDVSRSRRIGCMVGLPPPSAPLVARAALPPSSGEDDANAMIDQLISSSSATIIDDVNIDDETCQVGLNTVSECSTVRPTQSKLSATTNVAKCICGAGSFALPHVFLEEGVLGGTLAITACGALAAYTMRSLSRSKNVASSSGGEVTSYVELADAALGPLASKIVFALTLAASLGVCSTYLVFIGQTLESLSADVASNNLVRQYFPDVSEVEWELWSTALLYPLSLLRNYGVFAFTSALGVVAVLGGIAVTLAYGILVDPGGGLGVAVEAIGNCPMWPTSLASAFGNSFGTIAYLFCVNFLTFPIINSMKEPEPTEYGEAVNYAVAGVWVVNVVFAVLCLGFYGSETQDLVLGNLDNGPYLSALKLLLCVDLLFTFPIVFSSGRQILENALLGTIADESDGDDAAVAVGRAAVVAGGVAACFGLAQVGGFGAVANLVGGVAQGTLAFIMPPAIAVALSERQREQQQQLLLDDDSTLLIGWKAGQFLLGVFGLAVVSSVTYFTAVG